MGTCVSKCCPSHPTTDSHHSPDHSLTTTTTDQETETTKPSKVKVHPTSPTTTSTSSSTSFTSSATSSVSSSSSSACSSARRAAQKDRPFSSEFLLACAKDRLDIVVLDPNKPVSTASSAPPSTTRRDFLPRPKPAAPLPPRSLALRGPPSPRKLNRPPPPLPLTSSSKRGRSVSPTSCAGRKKSCSPDKAKRAAAEPEAFRPRVGQRVLVDGDAEPNKTARGAGASSEQEQQPSLLEDLTNPLISMDCFIFL